ncbi:MAG TPA: DUF6677 family protein [Vicinamibacteria bacterium]|nr:DUF6677 family protein [Vicinamibacteria bacterium]
MDTREISRTGQGLAAIPISASAWLVPGLGHLMLGKRGRGFTFFTVIVGLFVMGLHMHGELFALDAGEPLTLLAGLAEIGVGLPYFAAKLLGAGAGEVTSRTYEYGYTFLIVSGLLNALVVLDAYDIAMGRKD